MLATDAEYELEMREDTLIVHPKGIWTIAQAGRLDGRLAADVAALTYRHVDYEMSALDDLDTAGAYLLARAIRYGVLPAESWDVVSRLPGHKTLMQAATSAVLGQEPQKPRQWYDAFSRVGQATVRFWEEFGRPCRLFCTPRTRRDYHGDSFGRPIGFVFYGIYRGDENAAGNRRHESYGAGSL